MKYIHSVKIELHLILIHVAGPDDEQVGLNGQVQLVFTVYLVSYVFLYVCVLKLFNLCPQFALAQSRPPEQLYNNAYRPLLCWKIKKTGKLLSDH